MSRTDHGNKQNQHQDGIRSCCCQQVYGMIKNCASVRHEWAERGEAGEGMGADQGRLDPKGVWQVENAKWKGEGGASHRHKGKVAKSKNQSRSFLLSYQCVTLQVPVRGVRKGGGRGRRFNQR